MVTHNTIALGSRHWGGKEQHWVKMGKVGAARVEIALALV